MNALEAIVTHHAHDRSRERLKWSHAATQRMATRALNDGITHAQAKGQLKHYLSRLFLAHGKANNLRVYGRHVFVFADVTLITVLFLPKEFNAAVDAIVAAKKDAEISAAEVAREILQGQEDVGW